MADDVRVLELTAEEADAIDAALGKYLWDWGMHAERVYAERRAEPETPPLVRAMRAVKAKLLALEGGAS
jgi:hypothetical protein